MCVYASGIWYFVSICSNMCVSYNLSTNKFNVDSHSIYLYSMIVHVHFVCVVCTHIRTSTIPKKHHIINLISPTCRIFHSYLSFLHFSWLGFLLTTMLFLPFGRGQLREAIGMQLFSFFCFFFMMGVFHYELFMRGKAVYVCVYVCVCVCVCVYVCECVYVQVCMYHVYTYVMSWSVMSCHVIFLILSTISLLTIIGIFLH